MIESFREVVPKVVIPLDSMRPLFYSPLKKGENELMWDDDSFYGQTGMVRLRSPQVSDLLHGFERSVRVTDAPGIQAMKLQVGSLCEVVPKVVLFSP